LDAARLATLSNIVCSPRDEIAGDDLLRNALERIPPEYAEVLRLHFLHGMPHQKIAEFLSVPLSTVKWRCFRGKQMVRCIVHPEGCDLKRVADACRECPSRAPWCQPESREPLRIARAKSTFDATPAPPPREGSRKRRLAGRMAESTVLSLAFWSLTDLMQDLLPAVLPDLFSDVLPDFLPDLLALLTF
jgi:hypothetical protein